MLGLEFITSSQASPRRAKSLRRTAVGRLSQVACTQSRGSATCSVWAAYGLPPHRRRRQSKWPQGGERVRLTTGQFQGSRDATTHSWQQPHLRQGLVQSQDPL